MNRTPVYVSIIIVSICIAVILSIRGKAESIELPDLMVSVNVTEIGASPDAKAVDLPPKSYNQLPDEKQSIGFESLSEVYLVRHAEPYMNTKYSPRYPALYMTCSPQGSTRWNLSLSIDVIDASAPLEISDQGDIIYQSEVLGGHQGLFWQRGDVFFDEVKTPFPSIYKKVERKVKTDSLSYEIRQERILVGPERAFDDVLLPKLKTSKTMRLRYRDGTGPTFDLTNIKSDIERLEAECTPKDATNAK